MNSKNVRCAAAIKANLWNIVSGEWLLKCQSSNKLHFWFAFKFVFLFFIFLFKITFKKFF